MHLEADDLPGAIALVREALELARASRLPAPELDCLLRLTDLFQLDGDHALALDCGLQVLDRLDQGRSDTLTCRFLHALGRTYAVIDEYERGLTYVRQAYNMARSLPDPTTEGYVYLTLSMIYSRLDQSEEARAAIASALAMPEFEQLPVRLRAFLLHDAAIGEAGEGELDAAFAYLEQALALQRQAWLLATYASMVRERGDIAGARGALEEALALVAGHDYQTRAYVQCEMARLLIDTGEAPAGEALLRDVLALPNVEYAFREEALALLSRHLAKQGNYQAAYEYQLQRQQQLANHVQRQSDMRRRALDVEFRNELARREQQALQEHNQLLEQVLRERTRALEQQQQLLQTITELSTPVLPLVPGVLVLPIIGTVDSQRMLRMVGSVLEDVSRHRAHALILDITGVPLVDTQVAAAFLALARSVKLLGCRCVLVGIRPEIAQALVGLGITLGELTTRATLADGLAAVGVRIMAQSEH